MATKWHFSAVISVGLVLAGCAPKEHLDFEEECSAAESTSGNTSSNGESSNNNARIPCTIQKQISQAKRGKGETSHIVVSVNKAVITNSDINERCKMIALFSNRSNDAGFVKSIQAQVEQRLIDEALYEQLAEKIKIDIRDDMLNDAFADYSARLSLTLPALKQKLVQNGILESFTKMVRSRVISSCVVTFALPKDLARVSEKKIEQEIKAAYKSDSKKQYSFSEIVFCPGRASQNVSPKVMAENTYAELKKMGTQMPPAQAFALLAQQLSQGASAADGGARGWVTDGQFDNEIRSELQKLKVGAFSKPLLLKNGNCKLIFLNDIKEPGRTPYSQSSMRIAVVSIPFKRDETKEQLVRVERRVATFMDCQSEKEMHDLAQDFQYQFKIVERSPAVVPEIISTAKINTCAGPVFTGESLDIYMLLSHKYEKSKISVEKKEMQEILEQQKRVNFAEKIFKNFKNKALIRYNSCNNK
ncbi:MAG: peptidylprolyl isomerase [Holosporales bacterium]|jgi:parvulin-like peptidyl-prolyl isomerase|nr:peptidylprolyl isomerase [Holosporales bacterium]